MLRTHIAGVGISLFIILIALFAGPFGGVAVESTSMEPTLNQGDLVIAQEVGTVETGDVVVFERGEKSLVIHRVVSTVNDQYVTKGDANEITDQQAGHPMVSKSDVQSKVTTVGGSPVSIPFMGYLVSHFGSVVTTFLLVVVYVLILLGVLTGVQRAQQRNAVSHGSNLPKTEPLLRFSQSTVIKWGFVWAVLLAVMGVTVSYL